MNYDIFEKLITKAKNKPYKISKFYKAIKKRPHAHPKVSLRSLLLIHKYLLHGPPAVINKIVLSIIESITSLWSSTKNKEIQKYFSGTFRQTILQYCKIIELKYELNKNLPGDWKNLEISNKIILTDLVNYYQTLNIYSLFLFNLSDFTQIYKDIITTILEEQDKINNSIIPCIKESNDSSIILAYEEYHEKNLSFLHQFYKKYPLADWETDAIAETENVYKLRRTTLMGRRDSINLSQEVEKENSIMPPVSEPAPPRPKQINKEGYILSLADLEFEEIIGLGGSCTVYKGQYKEREVAIKVMKKSVNNAFIKEFDREVQTLSKISHPNLVPFLGACKGEKFCIVTEYCKGNTLFNLLHERHSVKLSWKQRISFAKDIANGMNFLHECNPPIIHRDLKSLNLLLSEVINSSEDMATIKITDFGVSRNVSDEKMTGMMGTCHWMAPEVLNDSQYSLPADVYSFGIVLWELIARETPYKNLSPTVIPYQVLTMEKRPDLQAIQNNCPEELKNLVVSCWSQIASNRPTFRDIITLLNRIDLRNN